MTDRIHIRDLHLRTIMGISDEERRDRQDVLISITLDTDLHAAGHSDDINISSFWSQVQSGPSAAERVFALIDAEPIVRFYEFQSGSNPIDGHNIRSFDLASYRRQLGIVSQTPFRFRRHSLLEILPTTSSVNHR